MSSPPDSLVITISPSDNLAAQLTLLCCACKISNTIFFCRNLPSVHIDTSSTDVSTHSTPWISRKATSTNALTRTRITFNTGNTAAPRPTTLVDTLLHEMRHVYFAHFVRVDDACICWQALRENLGATGHGRAFLWIASAMAEVSERFLGWRARIWGFAQHRREVQRDEQHCSLHDVDVCWPDARCQRPEYQDVRRGSALRLLVPLSD